MALLLYVNNGKFPRRLRLIEKVEPPSGFANKQLMINWSMLEPEENTKLLSRGSGMASFCGQ